MLKGGEKLSETKKRIKTTLMVSIQALTKIVEVMDSALALLDHDELDEGEKHERIQSGG